MEFDKKKSNEVAQKLLNCEFGQWGRGPDKVDCMGLVILYMKEFGIEMPDYSRITNWGEYMDEYVKAIPKLVRKLEPDEKLKVGDVIVFKNTQEITGNAGHASVYLGGNDFIHVGVKFRVQIDKLYKKYWKSKVYGYFRVREEFRKTLCQS